jgi:hypothetical protein
MGAHLRKAPLITAHFSSAKNEYSTAALKIAVENGFEGDERAAYFFSSDLQLTTKNLKL